MSKRKIDMAMVKQILDAGWSVRLFRGGLGSYVACGQHDNENVMERLRVKPMPPGAVIEVPTYWVDDDGEVTTDDFTPEAALTRLAYKVHGEII